MGLMDFLGAVVGSLERFAEWHGEKLERAQNEIEWNQFNNWDDERIKREYSKGNIYKKMAIYKKLEERKQGDGGTEQ